LSSKVFFLACGPVGIEATSLERSRAGWVASHAVIGSVTVGLAPVGSYLAWTAAKPRAW
jgi:hypothetical protein